MSIKELSGLLPGYGRGRVYGGPYHDIVRSKTCRTGLRIKMAKEIDEPCDVSIPTQDYSTPTDEDVRNGIRQAITALLNGKNVYVGCMGGVGRTGLFLAALTATLRPDMKDAVAAVRRSYYSHAVETTQQKLWVEGFVGRNRGFVRWQRLRNFWHCHAPWSLRKFRLPATFKFLGGLTKSGIQPQ